MIPISDFKKEVKNWAENIGLKPKEIHVRKMKHKWASCSSKRRLSFSFDLLSESKKNRDKAIVHELLHLRYSTHNKMFNSMLSSHLKK